MPGEGGSPSPPVAGQRRSGKVGGSRGHKGSQAEGPRKGAAPEKVKRPQPPGCQAAQHREQSARVGGVAVTDGGDRQEGREGHQGDRVEGGEAGGRPCPVEWRTGFSCSNGPCSQCRDCGSQHETREPPFETAAAVVYGSDADRTSGPRTP